MAQTVTMTFDNSRNRVRIQKSTLEALGKPTYIRVLLNKQSRTLVLQPVTQQEVIEKGLSPHDLMHIPSDIYTKDHPFEYQKQNIMSFMRSFTKWHPYAEYRVKGIMDQGVAFIDLDDYEIIVGGSPLRVLK